MNLSNTEWERASLTLLKNHMAEVKATMKEEKEEAISRRAMEAAEADTNKRGMITMMITMEKSIIMITINTQKMNKLRKDQYPIMHNM